MSEIWELGRSLLIFFNKFVIYYIILACFIYLVFFLFSFVRIKKERGLHKVEPYKQLKSSRFTPPLSILVPAYNEEKGIIGTVLSLITGSGRLDYPEFEVIVINDGSKDTTIEIMMQRFQMKEMKNKVYEKRNGIATQPIKAVFQSEIYPYLLMIDKENGGKSDALNAGINFAKYPYFASIDGDTILEPDSFLKIMKPIIENPDDEILATGGNVLIANGSMIDKGQLQEKRLSNKPLVIMQTIEYMRAFLLGRIGLSNNNILLIISGAFGVFKTSRVIQAGGYRVKTVGEDMELVVRLHEMNIDNKLGAKIMFVADPVCYTEVPEKLKDLKTQRMRWHRGLFESLWYHKKMFFNPRYKGVGLFAMPYFLFIELLGPLIEVIGYLVVVLGLILGVVNIEYSILLLVMLIIYGSFLSLGAVLLEEWRLGRYQRVSELNRLAFYSLTESLWYRPLLAIWRVEAFFISIFKKDQSWGEMKRKGVST
ncbi:MAG: glycosyltransferase family 2 protein [Anaerobacillus sp.]|uniref:glycosyltransferase family 2 protein n=1 Tax=Anaerobacillus sp. TaxID=1872506 RepID=UPI00391C43F1